MDFLIITGLSGAGKSRAADVMEDLDYYCVDNMPVALMPRFAELCIATGGRYENVATCALTLVLFLLPAFVERNFRVDLPDTLEIIILCFIFAAEILGELACWYVRYTGWDTLMHTINGFMAAAVGFSLVDLFNRNKRFQLELSPLFLALPAA